jgi:hypothetical protein
MSNSWFGGNAGKPGKKLRHLTVQDLAKRNHIMLLGDSRFEVVEEFIYLGRVVTSKIDEWIKVQR